MKNPSEMPPKCQGCPYWKIVKDGFNCYDCPEQFEEIRKKFVSKKDDA